MIPGIWYLAIIMVNPRLSRMAESLPIFFATRNSGVSPQGGLASVVRMSAASTPDERSEIRAAVRSKRLEFSMDRNPSLDRLCYASALASLVGEVNSIRGASS
jgi:hypothetical protein